MVTRQLLEYITSQIQKGIDSNLIRERLIQRGWKTQDILEAFSILQIDKQKKGGVEWSQALIRFIFGLVWLANALFKWQTDFFSQYLDLITAGASGQPLWLIPWFRFWISLVSINPILFATVTAITETFIALSLIYGFAQKPTYIIGIVLSLLIWTIPEGFGGPYSSSSVDVGSAIIYVFVFLLLMILNKYTGPNKYALDTYIEKKISWWRYLSS